MGQPITDHAAFFASAGQAVEELEALNTEVEQLEADEKKLESSLKGKQRSVTETISQTVKQRKEEITKSYDAELGKVQDRLKKVRAKREKAKNQGVKERIEEDTRGLVRENKELADQMKTLFKANHVPGFCRGSYYYALYFTRTFKDFLALLMTIMICFLAIPCGAYFLIPERRTMYLVGIYVAAILIFWCVSKEEGYYLLLMGFFGTVVNQFLKLLFRIPRPWVRDPDFTIVESARAQATGYSFPSGHTQNAVATFGGIARSTRRPWVRWTCVAVLLAVSFSRLYLGVHTPLDVGVSFAVAGVMVLALYPLIRQASRRPRLMAGLLAGMLLAGTAYLVFAYVHPFPADVDPANLTSGRENGWKLLGATVGFGISWWLDRRYIRFDTRAVWWVQLLKVVLGLALLMGIRAGLKAPLLALLHSPGVAGAVRYGIMVLFAGALWPAAFRYMARWGRKA